MATAKYSRYYTYIKPVIENKYVISSSPYIFSLISIAIFAVFAIRPTITTISNLQKQLADNQQVLDKLNQKAKDLTQAKKNYDNLDPTTKQKISLALPDQTNIVTLVTSLNGSIPKGASVSALQIQPVTLADLNNSSGIHQNISKINFTFNVTGSYQDLLQTLDNLHKSPRLISVDNIVMSSQESGSLVLSITGKGYFLSN